MLSTCSRCKNSFASTRSHCPSCGATAKQPTARETPAVCDACQKRINGTLERCDTCDGTFHTHCLKAHRMPCEDHATMLDIEAYLEDMK